LLSSCLGTCSATRAEQHAGWGQRRLQHCRRASDGQTPLQLCSFGSAGPDSIPALGVC
jgi:hypothetical protein